ncbi:phiSA1p31-related protein [Streptomyces griseus]|uniref:phiSA1p31-related protein n=1 Tax=Streptomyces griseus TaxID=1911 RepID=UPI0038692FA7|nr:phiSA1p31-related protein [Streptomyces fimicarius]
MAEAQYETRTRTVEETVVVLTMTEDEADALRQHIEKVPVSGVVYRVYEALGKPTPPVQPVPTADTFEYDGVTYELGAKYTDKDNDPWYFVKFGDDVVGGGSAEIRDVDDGRTLDYVMSYRPLTKVTS